MLPASTMPLRRLPLQNFALKPRSLKSYNESLHLFLTYSRLSIQTLLTAPASDLDQLLAVYLQHAYDSGRPFGSTTKALHAVVFYRPDLKRSLYFARQCLKGWARVRKSESYPPLTWELTVAIACTMASSGYHGPAVAMLVGFDCYLRVSELTALRLKDVVMPNDPRMGRVHTNMAVCLGKTKTGLDQSVGLQNPDVAAVLALWATTVRTRGASGSAADANPRVFAFSPDFFRRLIRKACDALGLTTPYVPHSLRHGGATFDFLRTNSVEHVQFRGRWKSLESVRRYVQTARALLAALDVPATLNELGATLSDGLQPVMSHLLSSVPDAVSRLTTRRVTFRL